jgi:hypothetical protein
LKGNFIIFALQIIHVSRFQLSRVYLFFIIGYEIKINSCAREMYDSDRQQDEIDQLAVSSRHDSQSGKNVSCLNVFESKEVRLALLTGAGLEI